MRTRSGYIVAFFNLLLQDEKLNKAEPTAANLCQLLGDG